MRIALYTETFLPKVDGIANTLCHLLDHLALRGHASLLFAPGGGLERYARTSVVGLPTIPSLFYPELRLIRLFVNVRPLLAEFKPDPVHLVNPVFQGPAALRAARRIGVPVNGFVRVKVWERRVDTTRFHPSRRAEAWRRRLSGGDVRVPLLLYVGRLSREKRIDWLRLILTALPQARLAIVGDGPIRPALERTFAGTPTVFTGYLRGDDLYNAYAAADVFAFPGAEETVGNVILEAMASGLPVAAPRSGGLLDHVVGGACLVLQKHWGVGTPSPRGEPQPNRANGSHKNGAWARLTPHLGGEQERRVGAPYSSFWGRTSRRGEPKASLTTLAITSS